MKKKEPIKNSKIWVVLLTLYALSVPWYFPKGSFNPIIFGVPYWVLVILGVSLAISIVLTYILRNCWKMTDEEEMEDDQS